MSEHPTRIGIHPAGMSKPHGRTGHKSPAVRFGDLIFVSGQVGTDPDGSLPESVEEQTRNIWAAIGTILEAAGSDVQHVLQTTTFMTSQEHVWTIDDVKREIFGADPPANAAIGVAELPYGATVEIQAIAGVTSQP